MQIITDNTLSGALRFSDDENNDNDDTKEKICIIYRVKLRCADQFLCFPMYLFLSCPTPGPHLTHIVTTVVRVGEIALGEASEVRAVSALFRTHYMDTGQTRHPSRLLRKPT